ncbi:hypothetical protein ACP4OV_012133 [Aristida adscensionis]
MAIRALANRFRVLMQGSAGSGAAAEVPKAKETQVKTPSERMVFDPTKDKAFQEKMKSIMPWLDEKMRRDNEEFEKGLRIYRRNTRLMVTGVYAFVALMVGGIYAVLSQEWPGPSPEMIELLGPKVGEAWQEYKAEKQGLKAGKQGLKAGKQGPQAGMRD